MKKSLAILLSVLFACQLFAAEKWGKFNVKPAEVMNLLYDCYAQGYSGIDLKITAQTEEEKADFEKMDVYTAINCSPVFINLDLSESRYFYITLGCPKLLSIKLPEYEDVKNLDFYACTNLKEIYVPENFVNVELYNCTSLEKAVIKSKCNLCLKGCAKLKKLELPPKLIFVKTGCFNGCRSLTEISYDSNYYSGYFTTYSETLEYFTQTFSNCDSLKKITIKNKEIMGELKAAGGLDLLTPEKKNSSFDKKRKEYVFDEASFNEELLNDDSFWANCEYIKTGKFSEKYFTIDGVLFKRNETHSREVNSSSTLYFNDDSVTLLKFPPAMKREVFELPDNCEIIGSHAFSGAEYLKEIHTRNLRLIEDSGLSKTKNRLKIVSQKLDILRGEIYVLAGNDSYYDAEKISEQKLNLTDNLRMRKGPSIYAEPLGTLKKGTKVRMIFRTTGPFKKDDSDTEDSFTYWDFCELLNDSADIKGNIIPAGTKVWLCDYYISIW